MTQTAAPVVARPSSEPAPVPAASQGSVRRRIDGRAAGGLFGLVLAATALRVEGIETWYWIDEALSVGIARHDLVEIPGLLVRDGSPPLWYFGLHGWTSMFGASVVSTHAFSLLFGVLAVPVAWVVGRRLFGGRAGWMAAALATISPFVTYFSRETRMYSLVVVLSLLVAGSFVRGFVDGRDRERWLFTASLVALLYTHNWGLYTGVACAFALVLVVFAAPAEARRAHVRRALVPFVLVAVAYLPWAPVLVSQVQNTGAPWSFTPSGRDVVRELAALFRDERVLVGLGLAAGTGLSPLLARRRSRDTLACAVLAVLAGVPVLLGWVLAHVEPSWATRYLAVVVAPLVLLLGLGLARARWLGVAALALAALLILQPLSRINGFPMPRDAKSNGHAVAARFAPRLAAGDLVVVAQPEAVPLFRHELGDGFVFADPTGVVEDPTTMDWRDAEERLRATSFADGVGPLLDALEPGQRVLYVGPGNASSSTDTTWIMAFRADGRRIQQALRGDERFTLVGRQRGSDDPYVTFDAVLYERGD